MRRKAWRCIIKKVFPYIGGDPTGLGCCRGFKEGDIIALGDFLYKSHLGQRIKYEDSCQELDFLVEMSRAEQVILGARMVGVGFVGCTLNILYEDEVERYIEKVSGVY